MENDNKKYFPTLPVKHWWILLAKFKATIPGVVTDSYLASILNIKKISAQTNILPSLKSIGLIDDDGKTLDVAKNWRDDKSYPKVCEDIRKKIYPKELLDAYSDPLNERDGVIRWFSLETGKGTVAINKMVAFYMLLVEADPTKATGIKSTKKQGTKKEKSFKTKKANQKAKQKEISQENNKTQINENRPKKKEKPDININLEIHISADASDDQIEKIFQNMAKYIYKD
jgi:hypothetical protein